VYVDILLRIRNPGGHVSVLPEGLVKDGLVQRFLGSTQPHAPLFDRSEVEEVGVDLVGEDGDEEATDGVEEVVVGGGLRKGARDMFQMDRNQARSVKNEKSSAPSYSGSRAVPTLEARPTSIRTMMTVKINKG